MILDQDVTEFVLGRFNPELADELFRGFELMFLLGYENPDSDFILLLMEVDEMTQEESHDRFLGLHRQKLAQILQEHSLYTKNGAPLPYLNEILSAVFLLQSLDDYAPIDALVNSDLDDESKVIEVLKYPSTLTDIEILESLEIQDAVFIQALQAYAHEKLMAVVDVTQVPEAALIENYRRFADFVGENECLGIDLIRGGLKAGLPFESYLSYLGVIGDTPQDALNVLSFLLLSQNGYKYPLVLYRKYSAQLSDDLNVISRVDALLVRMLGDFEHHTAQENDA